MLIEVDKEEIVKLLKWIILKEPDDEYSWSISTGITSLIELEENNDSD